jgi:hypothetical protein
LLSCSRLASDRSRMDSCPREFLAPGDQEENCCDQLLY